MTDRYIIVLIIAFRHLLFKCVLTHLYILIMFTIIIKII